MSIVRINNQETCEWLYGADNAWKDYVCENFDDNVVLTGNRRCSSIENADWYKKAVSLHRDILMYDEDELVPSDYNLTETQFKNILKMYEDDWFKDEIKHIAKIIGEMNPDDVFMSFTIKGYSQGEYQNVICKNDDDGFADRLEAFYFGKLAEIIIEDDNGEVCVDCISHDELWEHENNDTLKELLCERYGLDIDDTEFMISDGVVTTVKYKAF